MIVLLSAKLYNGLIGLLLSKSSLLYFLGFIANSTLSLLSASRVSIFSKRVVCKGVFNVTIPKWITDRKLILGFLLAHILLFFTFQEKNVFWYIFTASMLFLVSYSILQEEIEDKIPFFSYITLGSISGVILFAIFFLGNALIEVLGLPFTKEIAKLYSRLSPTVLWHYIVLLLVIIPGEEIFWRGFIQKRLQKVSTVTVSVFASSLMYASAHFYSGSIMLPFAALVSGVFWGYLYAWKKSLPLVIVSHLIFDLFLFVIYPLG